MHTVIIDGGDLDYFKTLVRDALDENYGDVSAVQLYVEDDGRIALGTNGYTSAPIGRPNAPLVQTFTSPEQALEEAVLQEDTQASAEQVMAELQQQHGNPYANISEESDETSEDVQFQGDSAGQSTDTLVRVANLEETARKQTQVLEGLTRVCERLTAFAESVSARYGLRMPDLAAPHPSVVATDGNSQRFGSETAPIH